MRDKEYIMNLEFSEIKLDNPGILKTRIPVRVFAELTADLQQQVDLKPATYNHLLAGHLETELTYQLKDSFRKCLELTCDEYRRKFNFFPNNSYSIDNDSWVNFQKKYEFNPVHTHNGMLSFVIYIKIPYDLEQEFTEGPGRLANNHVNGCFQFLYTNSLGQIVPHTLKIDKTFENKILVFPAKMNHCVYPFYTSDEYRISVSGNIFLDTSKYSK